MDGNGISSLNGMRILITGGASGIGLATARRMTAAGAHVGVLDRSSTGPDDFAFCPADICDDASVRNAVATLAERLDGLDAVVNNAGIGAQGGVEDNDDDEWTHVLDVNVVGSARVCRAALPFLRQSGRASIVNVSSVAATTGLSRRVLYSASKGALLSMTLAMAADLMAEGIRVNAVLPGTADTPWVQRLLDAAMDPEAERTALIARQPHGRLVDPDEIGEAICYLAAPTARSVTGTWVTVDGGISHLRPSTRT